MSKAKYVNLTGFTAWSAWLGVHMTYLRGFQNKLTTALDWSWDRLGDPQERLITSVSKQEAQAAVEA